jgi:D-alanyl-D-alanine carboxypeptidase
VAIAEAVGGDESDFAELMTRKAHALGMSHTLYRNASGLPNNEQITTAYDLAVLGRAIQDRFPRYYHYFSLHHFAFHGQQIANHNHLMDRVEGMDGIKTGYTAASGFNLLSSVKRDGHYIVSVVMGGKSARSRDAYMEALIEEHLEKAGPHHAGSQIAESEAQKDSDDEDRPVARHEEEKPSRPAEAMKAEPETHVAPRPRAEVAAPQLQLAAIVPEGRARPAYVSASRQSEPERAESAAGARAPVPHAAVQDGSTGRQTSGSVATPSAMRWQAGPAAKIALRTPTTRPEPAAKLAEREKDEGVSAHAKQVPSSKPAVSGWTIQIGATDDAGKAAALLSRARAERTALLSSARPYTEAVHKGHETIYRARFAGLEESRAEAACKALKHSGFACFATRN